MMLKTEITGDRKSSGIQLTRTYPENGHYMCVCVN